MRHVIWSSTFDPYPGFRYVIKRDLFGGMKQCKYMAILRDFPYKYIDINSALFGLVMTPVSVYVVDSAL